MNKIKINYIKKKNNLDYVIKVFNKLKKNKNINIIISGGKSPIYLYKSMMKVSLFNNFNFYLSDERISYDDLDNTNIQSLYKIFKSQLKNKKILLELNKKHNKLKKYLNAFISDFDQIKFNFAFLGIGNDGHIASLFSNHKIEKCFKTKGFLLTKKIDEYFHRVSIGESFLNRIESYIFYVSKNKKQIINDISNSNFEKMPYIAKLIKKKKKINFLIEI